MRKETPAQDKALVFLNTLIREHRENRRSRLPTLPELSARAGVASFTMHKAVQRLKKEGVLLTSHGRGIMLVPQTENEGLPLPAQADSDRYVPNWHKLVRRLQADIVKGVYLPDNQLPPLKFFMEKYGVGYPALRQALDFLCREELLVPYRKSYRVPTLAAKSHHGSVVLIASGDQAGTLSLFTCRTHEHLRILENECSKIQTNLVIYTYEQVKAKAFAPALFSRQSQPVLGFLVWTMGIESDGLVKCIESLQLTKKPIAILEETGVMDLSRYAGQNKKTFLYKMAYSSRCGTIVGRYLYNLGHRKIAYICPTHNTGWSPTRLSGVAHVFEAAGVENGVVPFIADENPDIRTAVIAMLTSGITEMSSANMVVARILTALSNQVDLVLTREAMRDFLRPLLEHAIENRDITAWVCGSDAIALECLDFLKTKGVNVPDDLSVIGFDDGLEAFFKRLTSFNFNGAAVIHAMLAYILDPQSARTAEGNKNEAEIDGIIIERATTAVVKKNLQKQ